MKILSLIGRSALAAATFLLVQSAWAAETVKIGILWPLTGNAAAAGQASKAADYVMAFSRPVEDAANGAVFLAPMELLKSIAKVLFQ